jgi:hypothetical protein
MIDFSTLLIFQRPFGRVRGSSSGGRERALLKQGRADEEGHRRKKVRPDVPPTFDTFEKKLIWFPDPPL